MKCNNNNKIFFSPTKNSYHKNLKLFFYLKLNFKNGKQKLIFINEKLLIKKS